jgi:hypothetical protein
VHHRNNTSSLDRHDNSVRSPQQAGASEAQPSPLVPGSQYQGQDSEQLPATADDDSFTYLDESSHSFMSSSDRQNSPLTHELRKLQLEHETNSPHKRSSLSKKFEPRGDGDSDDSTGALRQESSLEASSLPSLSRSYGNDTWHESEDMFNSTSSPAPSTRRPLPQVPQASGSNSSLPKAPFPAFPVETEHKEVTGEEASEASEAASSRPRVRSMYESPSKSIDTDELERPASVGGLLTKSDSEYSLPDIDMSSPLLFEELHLTRGESLRRTASIRRTDDSLQRGDGRQRINREKIQERAKAKYDNNESKESEGTVSESSSLASLELAQVVGVDSRAINARAPIRARAATLSDVHIPSAIVRDARDQAHLKQMQSPLDKLATDVQDDATIKGRGPKRRRSLSTSDATLNATVVSLQISDDRREFNERICSRGNRVPCAINRTQGSPRTRGTIARPLLVTHFIKSSMSSTKTVM